MSLGLSRMTDWIMTASGRPFWPLEPMPEDVVIDDIAHHLSHLCRFTGAVHTFYSVAQHSVLVCEELANAVPTKQRATAGLYGLLHDASEAYLMDVPRPLKHDGAFEVYREAEARLQAVIYQAFDLDPAGEPEMLKAIDRQLLRAEQRDLMPPPALNERRDDVEPLPAIIEPWWCDEARQRFLICFHECMRGRR